MLPNPGGDRDGRTQRVLGGRRTVCVQLLPVMGGSSPGGAMRRSEQSWERMFERLLVFQKRMGHCDVPTHSSRDPQLGRWVAAQRFKRKVGRLSDGQVARLAALGFTWSAADAAWDRMWRDLEAFRKREGHCNVPARWEANVRLATWVTNQRHQHRIGALPEGRVRRLQGLGFSWAIHRPAPAPTPLPAASADPGVASRRRTAPASAVVESPESEHRLYNPSPACYVQFNGHVPMPRELAAYAARHKGDLPAFIPLPRGPTHFLLTEWAARKPRKAFWTGRGRLPRAVLEYVVEHGVLPLQIDGRPAGRARSPRTSHPA